MRYADDVLAMRTYLRNVERIEVLMESFPVGSPTWLELDGYITEYFQMWGSCYDRLLNLPKWVWSDC